MRRFGVAMGLFGLSLLYDRLVIQRGDRQGWLEPYTAFSVVAGGLYTLAGVWGVDRKAAVLAFWMFVFSGTPMIAGDIERYLERARNGERALIRLEAKYGNGGGGAKTNGGV